MKVNNFYISFNLQIKDSIYSWQNWLNPSLNDIRSKYKRTYLGAIWNVIATIITLSIMAFVWSYVFKLDLKVYFPYIFNGFIVFFLFNNTIASACQILTGQYKDIILNIPISPLSLILRNFTTNLILYLHFFFIILIMYLFFYNFNIVNILFYFFGLIIFSVNVILISYICSIITTRFRDLVPLIQSILSALTLLTPIMWNKEMLGEKMNYVYLNPLAFMIEIVRDPIIGIIPSLNVYFYNIFLLIILYFVLFFVLKYKGNRIIFWI